jgi:hypothetical protein
MYVNDDYFNKWMEKLYGRICDIFKVINASTGANEVFGENEKPLDNQNLCLMLHISPRTLQRYRSEGLLPFFKRGQEIYYKTSDVRAFVYKNGDLWDKKKFEESTKAKYEE